MKILIKKIVKPLFNIVNKKYIKNNFRKNELKDFQIVNTDEITNKRILVLSPHQDDETIGMGATLKKLATNNEIDLIFVTNGTLVNNLHFPQNISEIRVNESKIVCELLGIKSSSTWNFTNTTLEKNKNILHDKMLEILLSKKYDLIFSPSITEGTTDHRVVTLELIRVIIDENIDANLFLYDINNSIPLKSVNSLVFLTDGDVKFKMTLYKKYKSQIFIDFDLINILDKYRGKNINCNVGGAEYFHLVKNPKRLIDNYYSHEKFDEFRATTSSVKFIKNMDYNITNCYNIINKIYMED